MNKLLAVLSIGLVLTGCTSETKYGPCVGLGSDDKDSKLKYEVDTKNVVLAFVFSETIFVPVIVVVKETYCPVSVKALSNE
jgi:hypothetical protein